MPAEDANRKFKQNFWFLNFVNSGDSSAGSTKFENATETLRQDRMKSKLKQMLKVFSEKRQGGALMPISSAEWEYAEAALNSGATVTVIQLT